MWVLVGEEAVPVRTVGVGKGGSHLLITAGYCATTTHPLLVKTMRLAREQHLNLLSSPVLKYLHGKLAHTPANPAIYCPWQPMPVELTACCPHSNG